MKTHRRILGSALLALAFGAVLVPLAGLAFQAAPKSVAKAPAVEGKPEEVHSALVSPREKNAAPAFLAWTWLTIGVLLYFLRLKIREADRVFRTGLYGAPQGHKAPSTRR
jgi:hypothetical protein